MDTRGVSPVVGLALLIGLVSLVSVGLLVAGASVIDSTTDEATVQQVERSMGEFATTADTVANGPPSNDQFEFGSAHAAGTGQVDGDAGQFEIVLERENGNQTTLVNTSLGVVRYELADGTELAYQGGGVWRHENDHSVLVSSPNLEYRATPVPTLTFPHVRVDGSFGDTGAVQGTLSVADEGQGYPINESLSNPVEGEFLHLAVESEYCDGWERHVERRTDAEFDERCDGDGRLVANLTVGDLANIDDTRDEGVGGAVVGKTVETNDWNDDSTVEGDVVYSDSVTSYENESEWNSVIDNGTLNGVPETSFPFDELEQRLDDHVQAGDNSGWSEFDASTTYDGPSTHYLEMDDELSDHTFDINATRHDQTIVIRDELKFSSEKAWLNVTGEKDVRIFVDADVEMNGNPNGDMGNPDDPANTTIVTSGKFKLTGDTNYHGVVAATNDVARVDSSGATVHGALVGETAKIETGNVVYDADGWTLNGTSPDPFDEVEADEVYYLHVSETVLQANS